MVPTCSKPKVNGAPTNFIVYNALSVHTRIFSFAVSDPIILVPSWSLCEPAVLVAKIVYSSILSCSENFINMLSWVEASEFVSVVPKWIKCLVVGDIKVSLDAVGLLIVLKDVVSWEALVDNRAAIPEFQVNVFPLAIVATSTWPKLLSDHKPGSSLIVEAATGSPHWVQSVALVTVVNVGVVTGAVVPNWDLTQPVNWLATLPV